MIEKKKKLLWSLRLGRIAIYLGVAFFLLALTPGDMEATRVLCLFRNFFQVACPSCGATRALVLLFHCRWQEAFAMNPLFTACLYPIGFSLIAQDLFCATAGLLKKKTSLSLLEYLFTGRKQM